MSVTDALGHHGADTIPEILVLFDKTGSPKLQGALNALLQPGQGMHSKLEWRVLMALITLVLLFASASRAAPASCGCSAALNEVATTTEVNYSGYRIKLPNEAAIHRYKTFKELLQEEASGATPDKCREIIGKYTEFFADHHLFAFPQKGDAPALPKPERKWTKASVLRYLADRDFAHSQLEGVWYDAIGLVALVPDAAYPAGTLIAIRLDGKAIGSVVAKFSSHASGYEATYLTDHSGWQRASANLRREGDLLVFGLQGFGREGATNLDWKNPLSPHFAALESGILYLSMPSFMPEHAAALNRIISEHGEALARADAIIFDVRGNAGGDAIYFPLADYFLANSIKVSEGSKLLASPKTIEYFESLRKQSGDNGTWLDEPLARMRNHPGEIVDYLAESSAGLDSYRKDPAAVVVLQDGGVGSAAEAFVYQSRQSMNVTTMGEPTRGNIDYMQVSMHTVGCDENAYLFGYPLYFNANLPAASVDDEGYAPDVRLPAGQDWLAFALRWVKRVSSQNEH